MVFLGPHYRFWTKNLLSVSRKSWKQSGFQGNVRSKAESVVARAAGLVRAEMHTALLDSCGATPTHSQNHHNLVMTWSMLFEEPHFFHSDASFLSDK